MTTWEIIGTAIVLILSHYLVFLWSTKLGIKLGLEHAGAELERLFDIEKQNAKVQDLYGRK
jgi:hypothetical protein